MCYFSLEHYSTENASLLLQFKASVSQTTEDAGASCRRGESSCHVRQLCDEETGIGRFRAERLCPYATLKERVMG